MNRDDPATDSLMRAMNEYQPRVYRKRFSKFQKQMIRAAFNAGRDYERSLQRALIHEALK